MSRCKLCSKEFTDYQSRGRTRCGSCNTKIRRYRIRAAAIKLLGGKCSICGWTGHQAALQFHHTNPQNKDFIISNVSNKKWETVKAEVEKCILLCANCHAILHSSKSDDRFIAEARSYQGRSLEF